jgi:hypothetical protein
MTRAPFIAKEKSMRALEALFLGIVLVMLIAVALPAMGNPGKFASALHYLQTGQTPQQPDSNSYSVVGSPSLSSTFINHILATANSPANGLGDSFYSNSVKYGIDDAFALAFFKHESTFGIYGEATTSDSIGNIRCLGADYADLGTWCQDNFAHFPNWTDGIEAWYRLIKNLYIGQWGCTTVALIIHHYAPAADHNNESAYTSSVESDVSTWRLAA